MQVEHIEFGAGFHSKPPIEWGVPGMQQAEIIFRFQSHLFLPSNPNLTRLIAVLPGFGHIASTIEQSNFLFIANLIAQFSGHPTLVAVEAADYYHPNEADRMTFWQYGGLGRTLAFNFAYEWLTQGKLPRMLDKLTGNPPQLPIFKHLYFLGYSWHATTALKLALEHQEHCGGVACIAGLEIKHLLISAVSAHSGEPAYGQLLTSRQIPVDDAYATPIPFEVGWEFRRLLNTAAVLRRAYITPAVLACPTDPVVDYYHSRRLANILGVRTRLVQAPSDISPKNIHDFAHPTMIRAILSSLNLTNEKTINRGF